MLLLQLEDHFHFLHLTEEPILCFGVLNTNLTLGEDPSAKNFPNFPSFFFRILFTAMILWPITGLPERCLTPLLNP
jgi:hypothetical protein